MCVCVAIYYINRTFNRKTNVLKKQKKYMCDQRTEKCFQSNINIYSGSIKIKFTAVSFRRTTPECLYSHRVFHPLWNVRRRISTHFVAPRDSNLLYLAKKYFKFSFDLHFFGRRKFGNSFPDEAFHLWLWSSQHTLIQLHAAYICIGARMIQRAKKEEKQLKAYKKLCWIFPRQLLAMFPWVRMCLRHCASILPELFCFNFEME